MLPALRGKRRKQDMDAALISRCEIHAGARVATDASADDCDDEKVVPGNRQRLVVSREAPDRIQIGRL